MKNINKNIKKRRFLRLGFVLLICIFLIFGFISINLGEEVYQAEEDETAYMRNNLNNDDNLKYTEFLKKYEKEIINSCYQVITPSMYKDTTSSIETLDTVTLKIGDEYIFHINAPSLGLYTLGFDYRLSGDSIIDTEVSMLVNSDTQYYEAQQLVFGSEWEADNDFKVDRYGNEILPTSTRVRDWYTNRYLEDGSSLHNSPLYIRLNKGDNEVKLIVKSGEVEIKNLYLENKRVLPTYQEYLKKYNNKTKYDGSLITLGAENIYRKSSLDVRVYALQDSTATRYDTKHKLLNAVYEASWDNGNQSISYNLDVKEEGLYLLSFKYLQDAYLNMPVQRTIYLNDEIPFKDLEAYPFYYTKRWKNETLHNEDGNLYLYLKQGINKLTLKVNMSIYQPVIEEIDKIMDEMNDLSLEIKSLTNGQTDTYRNWNISKYIPDLTTRLDKWCERINNLRDYLKEYSSNKKESTTFSSLKVAVNKLKTLAKDPDQIANRLSLFTDGSSSVSQVLGSLLLTLNNNPMGLERIYLGSETNKLPNPRENFFVRLFEGIKRFFISFFNKEYSTSSSKDSEDVEVWVNRSRQFVEVMQQMVDEAGLKVKFSIMPDQNKLILANSSGDLPDVAVGISNWIPYDLALRGITEDLRVFPGYSDLISKFAKGALIPYAYEDGMYGIPETQDFWVTFYRTDIYSSLKLNAPSTWQELVGQLTILQRLGYNFYSPLSSYRGLKPYVASLPLLYQYSASGLYENEFTGSLYTSDGMKSTLSEESYVAALKFMTNLFTIYNVPEETLSFYNSFRYGTLPIGIANSGTYTSLLIAAPEINGNWSIVPHIGYDNGSEVNRYSTAGSQGITMFSSSKKKDEAWNFIRWWMSTETQENYIQRIYSMYGLEYLWYSANLEAFEVLPIEVSHKQIIIDQLKNWSMEASRVPAAYMIERSISDAYSKVVFNGTNVRIALDDAVIDSNREIERKMTEFNYISKGKKVKDYIVPSIKNIDNWLTSSTKKS